MSTLKQWTWAGVTLMVWASLTTEARAWQGGDDESAEEDTSEETPFDDVDLLDLSLEELLQVEITSVSKREERQFAAPAAVSVLTEEDIRRSGIRQLPELFRLVPGMQVGQINAHTWAISTRGFAGEFSNKLQVLQDGRSLYTHLFSGVYWQVQRPFLADIDRIEIIRGPGATLWGANSVNGVINIITKSARDTQGGYLEAGSGSEIQGFSGLRYGGRLSEDSEVYYRVWAQHMGVDSRESVAGIEGFDDWQALNGGFRIDGYTGDDDHYMFQGSLLGGKFGGRQIAPLLVPPVSVTVADREDLVTGNVLARYESEHSDSLSSTAQFFYDRLQRESGLVGDITTDTLDFDYQLDWNIADGHNLTTGVGYRAYFDDLEPALHIDIHRRNRLTQLLSFFVQDQIDLVPDKLHLTAGAKLEQNQFTNLAFQPNLRLSFEASENHVIWGAVSRALRLPYRYEDEGRIRFASFPAPGSGIPTELQFFGNKDVRSEELTSFELGYRTRPAEDVILDIAGFLHDYDHLTALESGGPILNPDGTITVPQFLDNNRTAQTYGFEVEWRWKVVDSWRLQGTYSFLKMIDRPDNRPRLFQPTDLDKEAPRNQATLRSQWNLSEDVELDAFVSYVDVLSGLDVPAYVRTDLRLAWRPSDDLELSLVGQNLFDPSHPEFPGQNGLEQTEVERNIFFSVALRF